MKWLSTWNWCKISFDVSWADARKNERTHIRSEISEISNNLSTSHGSLSPPPSTAWHFCWDRDQYLSILVTGGSLFGKNNLLWKWHVFWEEKKFSHVWLVERAAHFELQHRFGVFMKNVSGDNQICVRYRLPAPQHVPESCQRFCSRKRIWKGCVLHSDQFVVRLLF